MYPLVLPVLGILLFIYMYIRNNQPEVEEKAPPDDEEAGRGFVADEAESNLTPSDRDVLAVNGEADGAMGIRERIVARPIDLDAPFQAPVYPKTQEQKEKLLESLDNDFLFDDLNEKDRNLMIDAMQQETFKPNEVIIEQGDTKADYFYVVDSGTVMFVDKGKVVGDCSDGASFGELALLYDSPRAVSCIASGDPEGVVLWKLDRFTFRRLLAESEVKDTGNVEELLAKVDLFSSLPDHIIKRMVDSSQRVEWREGERILQKGQVGNDFHIVESGTVRVHDIGLGDSHLEDQVLRAGDWFGERALYTGEPRGANVTAVTKSTTLMWDRQTFEMCVGFFQELMDKDIRRRALQSVPSFANAKDISPREMELLAERMREVKYNVGEVLTEADKTHETNLWIIRNGALKISCPNMGYLYTLKSGDYMGDNAINTPDDVISNHTSVTEEPVTAWILSRDDVIEVLRDVRRLAESKDFVHASKTIDIPFRDLKRLRYIGKGAFGKVYLVSHTPKGGKRAPYALKEINKRMLLKANQEKSVLREKELLSQLNHPFILPLVSSYKDEENLYFLLPFIQGGELYSALEKQKSLTAGMPNNSAGFYAACVLDALIYFHQRLIAYRDLKLENCLIDNDGYCVVIDLGLAKLVSNKTFTLVGTPEYLAPEVIMSKGHDKSVDCWAFGVLVYELIVGRSPFYVQGASQMAMFKRIVLLKYTIPDFVSEAGRSLIDSLLVRRASHRLGNLAGGEMEVKEHRWFKEAGIDFMKLFKKEITPPWLPPHRDPFDLSNFNNQEPRERLPKGNLTKEEQALFDAF